MGAVVAIDINKLPEALKKNEAAVRAAIARGIVIGAQAGRAILVRATPVDQGQLRAAWRVEARLMSLPPGMSTPCRLVNDAPHAGIVELGARPHNINPAGWTAIYQWVRRHPELYTAPPMAPRMRRDKGGGRGASPFKPFWGPDPQIMAITNAIVRKIAREGQKPTYFIRKSLDAVQRVVLKQIAAELQRAADNSGGA